MASTDENYEEMEPEDAIDEHLSMLGSTSLLEDITQELVDNFDVYTEAGGNELGGEGVFVEDINDDEPGVIKLALSSGHVLFLNLELHSL